MSKTSTKTKMQVCTIWGHDKKSQTRIYGARDMEGGSGILVFNECGGCRVIPSIYAEMRAANQGSNRKGAMRIRDDAGWMPLFVLVWTLAVCRQSIRSALLVTAPAETLEEAEKDMLSAMTAKARAENARHSLEAQMIAPMDALGSDESFIDWFGQFIAKMAGDGKVEIIDAFACHTRAVSSVFRDDGVNAIPWDESVEKTCAAILQLATRDNGPPTLRAVKDVLVTEVSEDRAREWIIRAGFSWLPKAKPPGKKILKKV